MHLRTKVGLAAILATMNIDPQAELFPRTRHSNPQISPEDEAARIKAAEEKRLRKQAKRLRNLAP